MKIEYTVYLVLKKKKFAYQDELAGEVAKQLGIGKTKVILHLKSMCLGTQLTTGEIGEPLLEAKPRMFFDGKNTGVVYLLFGNWRDINECKAKELLDAVHNFY